MRWIVVDIRQEYCLREGRLDVFPRAAVAMSACSYLNEELERVLEGGIPPTNLVVE